MAKYTPKCEVIEAIQFTGENYEELKEFIGDSFQVISSDLREPFILMRNTYGGAVHASKGDYVMKNPEGDGFLVGRDDIFKQRYVEIKEGEERNG